MSKTAADAFEELHRAGKAFWTELVRSLWLEAVVDWMARKLGSRQEPRR